MSNPDVVRFEYKVASVAIELRKPPQKSTITITPPKLSEIMQRELMPLCFYFVQRYKDEESIPTLEEAKEYSAYLCIDRDAFGGDITTWNPRDLAREAGVTEEFAQFRIRMDLESNHWRKSKH